MGPLKMDIWSVEKDLLIDMINDRLKDLHRGNLIVEDKDNEIELLTDLRERLNTI